MRLAGREAAQQAEGGSVGAAVTPEGQLGEEFAQQNRALQATEEAGAEINNPYERAMRERAEAEGYTPDRMIDDLLNSVKPYTTPLDGDERIRKVLSS